MTKTDPLADVSPGDLDKMIAALAREHEVPQWVYSPDLVDLDRIPDHIHGFNRGCTPSGIEMYREGQKWRRRLIAELCRRPDWIAEWHAARDLDQRIEDLCRRKGLEFRPWEMPPWRAPDELPEPSADRMHAYGGTIQAAVRLRRRLIAELEAGAPEV